MSKLERQRPFIFGRVFFPGESKPIPQEVRFQPLGNHVGNVMELVKAWRKEDFSCNDSFDRVLEAARIHDAGKPQKFELQSKDLKGKFKEYIYSFRGHRFLAKSKKDKWVEVLAVGHHDFSVRDIARDAYSLKKEQQYTNILAQEPLAYARELYILEMCDQIEAELACRVLDDTKQAESRAFMDFTIAQDEIDPSIYRVDPWAFEESSIALTFKYWSMRPAEVDQNKELQKCMDENREVDLGKTLDRITKRWWQSQQGHPKESGSKTITLKPYLSVDEARVWTATDFYEQLAGFKPNPMQAEMFDTIYDQKNEKQPAILLKAPTGSGKTESILFPALASNYRLFLPLPARSLLEDQKERIEKYLKAFSKLHQNREFSLVVDTGSQMYRWVYKNGDEVLAKRTSNPRRHLYKGDVILTTIDKFLYRYFAFGDQQKSFIFPLRIHREKTLICFDEAHSYDEISFTNFQSLVQSLYEAGRSLVLMTATMPPELAKRFDYLDTIDYTDKLSKQPERSFEWINDLTCDREKPGDYQNPDVFQKSFAEIVLKEWRSRKRHGRVIAVVETVRDAVAIYQQLKDQLGTNSDSQDRFLFLYHGRISDTPKDSEFSRSNIYKQVKQRDNNTQAYVLVTTSAIEVGCDLNAEVLISQVCPPENLIQRAGRCNRRGNVPDAKVIVVGDHIPDIGNRLSSLDNEGWSNYQATLQQLTTFDAQKIGECIKRSQHVDDYRVVELFSMLHDYVYGADLTCQPTHEKGLVITRSWTPSATLIYDDGKHDTGIDSISKMPQTTVPVDRLLIRKNDEGESNQYANTNVYERYYDQEQTRWVLRPLRWGCAYSKDIVIKLGPYSDSAFIPSEGEQYEYKEELGFSELPGVFIKLRASGFDEKLLCQHKENDGQKSAIITYTKAMNNEQ